MKVQSKVGFLGKNSDNIEYLNYYDVFNYCLGKIKEEGRSDDFNNSGLSPFDYMVDSMHYIFVNPLFNNDKYLICQNSTYYVVNKEKVLDTCDMNPDCTLYQNIMMTFYDDMDPSIFMLQVSEDTLRGVDFLDEVMDCFIGSNGRIIKKEEVYRHSMLANTICNNELIKSNDFCQLYFEEMIPSSHYSELFLVGKCNFVEIDYTDDVCVLLYNKERINDKQRDAIRSIVKEDATIQSMETQKEVSSVIIKSNQKTGEDSIRR